MGGDAGAGPRVPDSSRHTFLRDRCCGLMCCAVLVMEGSCDARGLKSLLNVCYGTRWSLEEFDVGKLLGTPDQSALHSIL